MPNGEKVKEYLDRAVEVSKSAISKTSSAIRDFGDKSVVMIEIKQLEGKRNRAIIQLGTLCFDLLKEAKDASCNNKDVADIVSNIKDIDNNIVKRRHILDEMKKEAEKARQNAKLAKQKVTTQAAPDTASSSDSNTAQQI